MFELLVNESEPAVCEAGVSAASKGRQNALRGDAPRRLCSLRLFGGLRLLDGTQVLEVRGAMPALVLARIAMAGPAGAARESLTAQFWPDRSPDQARHSLRQTLVALRALLGQRLAARGQHLVLEDVDIDAVEYARLAARADAADDRDDASAVAAAQAAALYAGAFLEGMGSRVREVDDWIATERANFERQQVKTLLGLAQRAAAAGGFDEAITRCRELLALEPLHEAAQVLLLEALQALGERAAAIQQYRDFADLLWRDLGARPAAATTQAYRRILDQPAGHVGGAVPMIAVLPFDATHALLPREVTFADGLALELVRLLSRVRQLAVIDQHDAPAYRRADADLRVLRDAVGASWLLRGSVRASGGRLRVDAQLIAADTLQVRWAERYEGDARDLFSLQESMSADIVTALQVQIGEGEQSLVWRHSTRNVDAWLLAIEGLALVRGITRESTRRGRALLEAALARDPDYAAAWVFLGWSHVLDLRSGWSDDARSSVLAIERCAARALALSPDLPDALNLQGGLDLTLGRHDAAIAVRRRSVALAPNHSESHAWLAAALYYGGHADEAAQHIALAMRFSPFYPPWYPAVLGWTRLAAGRLIEAERAFGESCARAPDNLVGFVYQVIAQTMSGRLPTARRTVEQVVRRNPGCTLAQARRWLLYRDQDIVAQRLECLREAGLPAGD